MQNVNATQSLGERILHVGTVTFDTAGEAEFDFAFRGIENPRAIVRTVDRAAAAAARRRPAPPGDVERGAPEPRSGGRPYGIRMARFEVDEDDVRVEVSPIEVILARSERSSR